MASAVVKYYLGITGVGSITCDLWPKGSESGAAAATLTLTESGSTTVYSGTTTAGLTGAYFAKLSGGMIGCGFVAMTDDTTDHIIQSEGATGQSATDSASAIKTQTDKLTFDGSNNIKVASNVKKNQALAKFQFGMTDSTNHAPATGKTVSCTRSIDGGAFGAGTLANAAELSDGDYVVDFGAGDLNGNVIVLKVTASGCDVTFERLVTDP